MENQDVFLIIIIAALVFLYLSKMYETYVSGSFDITPAITVGMDWKGSQVAGLPYYPNNLSDAPQKMTTQIKKLQSYESNTDGPTDSNYVASGMQIQSDINNVNSLEGFTMMNPYVSN